jgi:hypothetical protein
MVSRGAILKRAVLLVVYLGFLALLLEGAGFLLSRLSRSIFSDEAAFVEKLRGMEEPYRRFVAERYHGILGWDGPRATTVTKRACDGHTITETYLRDRSRRTPEAAGGRPILAFGDSFTLGGEVGDDDSYPAQLSRLLERKVINYGVNGYCPLQAVLKFQLRAADQPGARTVVLGIMSDDIFRLLNSYRPVLVLHTSGVFAFKPYMRGATQAANPNGPEPAPFDVLPERARRAFREDYWALAEPRFPYALSLFDFLSRPSAWVRLLRAVDRSRALRQEALLVALGAVLESFVASARAMGMAPVVLLIPDDPRRRHVFDDIVPELRARFGARAVITAVRDAGYRWEEYLPRRRGCHHPTAYGYQIIAEHAARAVREAEQQADRETPGKQVAPDRVRQLGGRAVTPG